MAETTRQRLLDDLRALGIGAGCRLAVHCSYKAIGPVTGGPGEVVAALLEAVGPDGTLVMPTFQDTPPPLFRRVSTPSECGIVTEVFRTRPGIFRSLHPTHSAAALGRDAQWIAAGHEDGATALGVDCPFDRLARKGGDVLLLGVGLNRCSMVHVGEAHARVPYLPIPYSPLFAKPVKVELDDGRVIDFVIRECPGCSENFGVLRGPLESDGLVRSGCVGNAPALLVPAQGLIETVRRVLAQDALALLCAAPACPFCPAARTAVRNSNEAMPRTGPAESSRRAR